MADNRFELTDRAAAAEAIRKLSEGDLHFLNRLIVERLKLIHQARSTVMLANFNVGDRVRFPTGVGDEKTGVIVRLNKKTASIATDDGQRWNVHPGYLSSAGTDAIEPPLLAWAMAGRKTALVWVRLESRSWTRVCANKESLPPCPPSVLLLPQLGTGRWKAELWDTWSGRAMQEQMVESDTDGNLRVPLPEIAKDLAVRLNRID